jgi:hypothetical protein
MAEAPGGTETNPLGPRRRSLDVLGGSVCAAAVLSLYLATLAPGLLAVRDSPAFQFVGRVLGVPHQPSYPFYVLLSYAFSYVPIGSLAYRMNLLSAVLGAATSVALYLACRTLRVSVMLAVAVAVSAAAGPLVWSQSVIAEVYTLETLLLLCAILAWLHWRDSRSAGTFYAAVFLCGLLFAHHTNDVLFAPGLVLFVWCVDRRWLLRPGTLARAAFLLILAFTPYALILIRTMQGAPYVLEPAHGLGDLVRIATGMGYRENVFPFSLREVFHARVPLAASILWGELTAVGCLAATVGISRLLWTRHPLGLALVAGSGLQLAFLLNYDIPDIAVFFIPVITLAWLVAGVGLQACADRLRHRRFLRGAWLVACGALPLWLMWNGYALVGQRWNVAVDRYMSALVAQLPHTSVFLAENWVADQLVRYKTLGEGLPGGKLVEGPLAIASGRLDTLSGEGRPVFAFASTAGGLRTWGFRFIPNRVFVPLRVVVESLAPGSVVAVAIPASSSGVTAAPPALFASLGGTSSLASRREAIVLVGTAGSRRGALEHRGRQSAEVAVEAGAVIGTSGVRAPVAIRARAGLLDAEVTIDGRILAADSDEIAMAVWNPDGRLVGVYAGTASTDAPVAFEPLETYRLSAPRQCVTLPPDSWTIVGPRALSPVLAVAVAPACQIEFDVESAEAAPKLQLLDWSRDAAFGLSERGGAEVVPDRPGTPRDPNSNTTVFRGSGILSAAHLKQLGAAIVSVGAFPSSVRALVDGPGCAEAVRVCAVDLAGLLTPVGRRTLRLGMANDEQALAFGRGWLPGTASSTGPVRRIVDSDATVFVSLPDADSWVIALAAHSAGPDPRASPAALALRVDGFTLPAQAVVPGWHVYRWSVTRSMLTRRTTTVSILTFADTNGHTPSAGGLVVGSLDFRRTAVDTPRPARPQ